MSTPSKSKKELWFSVLVEIPSVVVVFGMVLLVTGNALLRTFAGVPIANTLEWSSYVLLPIVALLGFVAAQHRRDHISTDLIFQWLPERSKPWVLGILQLIAAVAMLAMAWFSLLQAIYGMGIGLKAGLTAIPIWPVMFLVPIVSLTLTVQFLLDAKKSFIAEGFESDVDLQELQVEDLGKETVQQ